MTSNSSSERPEPTATHVSGDSARCAGIWVSSLNRSSRPCRSDPPPASMMPRSMMSDASSGRRAVEALLDRVDDLRQRLLEGLTDLLGGQHHRLGQAGDHVASADLGLHL